MKIQLLKPKPCFDRIRCDNHDKQTLAGEKYPRLSRPLLLILIGFAAFILSASIAYEQELAATDLSTPKKALHAFIDALAHDNTKLASSFTLGSEKQLADAKLNLDVPRAVFRLGRSVGRFEGDKNSAQMPDYDSEWQSATERLEGDKATIEGPLFLSFRLQKSGQIWKIDLQKLNESSDAYVAAARKYVAGANELANKLEQGFYKKREDFAKDSERLETLLAAMGSAQNQSANAQLSEAPQQDNDGKVDADATIAANSLAIQLKAKDANAFVTRGDANFEKGDWDSAIADYSRAIELDPKNARACRSRGYAKAKKKDWDGAIADYSRAIELEPNSEAAYSNRGIMKTEKKDWDGAIADYSRAIELDPKYVNNYINRGYAKKQKKDWDGAIADYSRAIELDPKFAIAYKNRGTVKREKKDWDGAIADYSRAIELDPKDASAYSNRGTMKMEKKDWDGAIADYNHAIEFGDNDAMIYVWRGLAHTGLSDNASGKKEQTRQSIAAVEDFTQSIQLSPTAQSFYFRSTQYERLEQYEKALKDAEEAVRLDPTNVFCLNQRGWMYRRTHSESLALKDFRRALELDPGNKDSTDALKAPSESSAERLLISGAVLGAGLYFLDKMLTDNTETKDRKQDDRVTKTVETSAGAKMECPKCGGRGKIVRLQFGDSWATYEYRIGEEPSYDLHDYELLHPKFWYPKCDRCDGTGVVNK